jgi:endoglucanase
MHRRTFLKSTALGTAALIVGARAEAAAETETLELARNLPRWRGFNLLEKFMAGHQRSFLESDFQWMADWGFDFVRLPLDYRCWTDGDDPYRLNEKVLGEIDQAVEFGQKHHVHVCLNLHRAPGYCVNKPAEKLVLWTDDEEQKQFDFQWSGFARRYRGISSEQVSFNLLNEPPGIEAEAYDKVVRRVTQAIRNEDPQRLIIADGLRWGTKPTLELADLGIAQGTRGYDPTKLTHFGASWVNGQNWPSPSWPLKDGNRIVDREWLLHNRIEPWKKLQAKGVGVHVGEWGAFNKTLHDVTLAWARDCLGLWKDAGWGWALWNFRGAFGILDSERADVAYEDFQGHKLDRELLDLLRAN